MRTVSYNSEAIFTAFIAGILVGFALANGWIG